MTSIDTAASSSSSTLWATASKEWVIAPKPKPGRKPKKDVVPQVVEADSKGRRVQNRAAQRAFRERKQSQLADLQARIQAYEQGEIERNVALQKIAKQLKEENENLRQENASLKAKVVYLESQLESLPPEPRIFDNPSNVTDKKRGREASPSAIGPPFPPKKRSRKDSTAVLERHTSMISESSGTTHLPSPTSMVSTPDSFETIDQFPPLSFEPSQGADSNTFSSLSSDAKSDIPLRAFPFDCGFCDETTICVCREIAAQAVVEQSLITPNYTGSTTSRAAEEPPSSIISGAASSKSILENLPTYQPPVPLRRRTKTTISNSIFPVHAPAAEPPTCSGDPSNCMACADDAFGKAFCSAIGSSATTCDCSAEVISRCCGGTSDCNDCPSSNAAIPPTATQDQSELMPTNDAWQKIKAHPKAEFADLALLAKVVASQSKCAGPQLVITPTPQTHVHEDEILQATKNPPGNRGNRSPPPQLVPQEVLLECGRRRMRQVHSSGVYEALRLLDAKFA
ncbi:hypothetical protein CPB83DRAFT_874424 [Crepidotus variabilis]|uniref:BZIP domain-containing protein n=1 Tax=Crepidotus variabilis TaxID=179855 RepID=A0A9P6ELK9_9AGAR|nr:hypothetical protein CPB83DRAFT_874424 [Crepidotus variabilis]